MKKKIFVSGCFDMLHSGHVYFLDMAAHYGDVYVSIGSDETIKVLKGVYPVFNQAERKYMLEALKVVTACFIGSGSGVLDFLNELKQVSPDIFVVNEDGHHNEKARLCKENGIKYVVLKRKSRTGLPVRSTSSLRNHCKIPYRIDLAGGWLDQPFVSKHAAGPVITLSLEPVVQFNERSGMATSTRQRAIELWPAGIPDGNREKLAKALFCYDNPPGTIKFSGSQDSIGIIFPGLNRLDYNGDYWPAKIVSVINEDIFCWLEEHIHLIPLYPRKANFEVLKDIKITDSIVKALSLTANSCWNAIQKKNADEFGNFLRKSFEIQTQLFPNMVNKDIRSTVRKYANKSLGWKLSGAGGGGYLVLVSKYEFSESIKIKIRRK